MLRQTSICSRQIVITWTPNPWRDQSHSRLRRRCLVGWIALELLRTDLADQSNMTFQGRSVDVHWRISVMVLHSNV